MNSYQKTVGNFEMFSMFYYANPYLFTEAVSEAFKHVNSRYAFDVIRKTEIFVFHYLMPYLFTVAASLITGDFTDVDLKMLI